MEHNLGRDLFWGPENLHMSGDHWDYLQGIRAVSLGFEKVFKGLEELVSEGFQTFFFLRGFSENSDIKELGSVAFMLFELFR